MKKVFISYARIDRNMARRVFESLKNEEDIEPWFDEVRLTPIFGPLAKVESAS